MSKLVFNRDGGKTDEFGHLISLMRFMQGEVIEGLLVAANGSPNMTVNVPYGTAAIPTGSGATGYRYFVGLDATESVAIPTANGSNPRNDLIVLWVDKAVTPSQSFTNNSNNMLKISVVSGAPASTPADPSGATIQAAIGAGNPYIILARVLTGAGVTQINSGNITDLRSLTGITRLLTNQILTAHITDLNVTTAKLAANAVTAAKMDFTTLQAGLSTTVKNAAQKNMAVSETFFFSGTDQVVVNLTRPTSVQIVFNCAMVMSGDSEYQLRLRDNGVELANFTPNAAATAGPRSVQRSMAWAGVLAAGNHTIQMGVTTAGGNGGTIFAGAAMMSVLFGLPTGN
jgi:hypothetical protein